MDTKRTKIRDIIIQDNMFYIVCDEKYMAPIVNGSVSFKIYDTNRQQLYLDNININDNIKLYYKNNIIKKIIINLKYDIISDSSDMDDF